MLLVFCGGKHDPNVVLAGLTEAFPGVPIVGGSAAGVISREGLGISGVEIGVVAVLDPSHAPKVLTTRMTAGQEFEAGARLGEELRAAAHENALVLLFYDSVASTDPLRLHYGSSIVAGLNSRLRERRVLLVGAGMLTDLNLTGGWIFDGNRAVKHAAVALVFPPELTADLQILHGCAPAGDFMTITKVGGAEVFELDGQPALQVIEGRLGLPVDANLSLVATLGQKTGDRYAPYSEKNYVNRLILSGSRDRGSILLFEPDFPLGTSVQIMTRNDETMFSSVHQGVREINQVIAHSQCLLGLYIDCAGRAALHSGTRIEEADVVRSDMDVRAPLMGFYSGVEIAPFNGSPRALDWTGVLVAIRRA